ncbi:MAG: hypothetical protein IPL53_07905 [Ignavibacteria bacterium]|nr:hypothetical protein [Ignavibacteria bacterium]
MDINAEAGLIGLIPPLTAVFTDYGEESPGFLPAINPNKNGLNISERDGKYYGEGSNPLIITMRKSEMLI